MALEHQGQLQAVEHPNEISISAFYAEFYTQCQFQYGTEFVKRLSHHPEGDRFLSE